MTAFTSPLTMSAQYMSRNARTSGGTFRWLVKDDLTTGDLVFFKTRRFAQYPTHVGIYIGDGEFIHTSSFMRRGVRADRLSDAYFSKTYAGAVRVKAPPAENTDAE
jgi:cell wall-associated NlpC family hydrolase